MGLLRGYLILAWLLLGGITAWAVTTLGFDAGKVFFSDFAHAWRAQTNTDFLLHVVPIAAWVYWRERSKAVGLLCALGTSMGGVFTLLYLLVATYRAEGDVQRLLLGHHAT
jgi:peptidoglycan biosynthesis protein MviN/MurJ (putative lipid II flippase)